MLYHSLPRCICRESVCCCVSVGESVTEMTYTMELTHSFMYTINTHTHCLLCEKKKLSGKQFPRRCKTVVSCATTSGQKNSAECKQSQLPKTGRERIYTRQRERPTKAMQPYTTDQYVSHNKAIGTSDTNLLNRKKLQCMLSFIGNCHPLLAY